MKAEEPLELEEDFYLWPECLPAFNVFQSLQSQWRVGMAGATGLDYTAVEAFMRMNGVRRKDQAELLYCLQVMEFATLREWASRR